MNKYLAIPLFILSWTLGPSQDLIVTRSGDSLIGHIIYESPKHFRIKYLSGRAADNYGTAASISRDQVIYVRDSLPAYKLHKFGKIKIYSIHSDKYIHKPFYSANDSSITYISSSKNLRGKGWSYRSYDIPIADIEMIRWSDSKVGGGIVIGGLTGAIAGGLIGGTVGSSIDVVNTLSTFSSTQQSSKAGFFVGLGVGAVVGATIGGLVGAATSNRKVDISIHGNQEVWNKRKHMLPASPSRFLFHMTKI